MKNLLVVCCLMGASFISGCRSDGNQNHSSTESVGAAQVRTDIQVLIGERFSKKKDTPLHAEFILGDAVNHTIVDETNCESISRTTNNSLYTLVCESSKFNFTWQYNSQAVQTSGQLFDKVSLRGFAFVCRNDTVEDFKNGSFQPTALCSQTLPAAGGL